MVRYPYAFADSSMSTQLDTGGNMTVSKFGPIALALIVSGSALSAQQGPPVPQPGPEHKILAMDVGTWDATVEMTTGPGTPPMTSKVVEVNTLGCGGLCLISDLKGEFMPGMPFHGHGTTVWDSTKKKYVGSWTDSMSAGLSLGESTWDPAAKKMTGWVEGPDMNGKVTKVRSVVEHTGPDTRIFTMYAPGPDGKEIPAMKITYKRR
jgi:hypothetical protein